MHRLILVFGLLMAIIGTSTCPASEPRASSLDPHLDHYIRDYSEGSDYYWLRRDGSYKAVHHFDTQWTMTIDHGHWNASGSRMVLRSDGLVPVLRTDDFSINVFNSCGFALLATLRERVSSKRAEPKSASQPDDDIEVRSAAKGPVVCVASVSFTRALDANLLKSFQDTVDAWSKVPDPERFEFDVWAYRRRTFLIDVPAIPGPRSLAPPLAHVKREIDAHPDSPPEFVFYEGTREEFVRADVCDFPRQGPRCLDSENAERGSTFIVP